jgi:xanthine dehydrogenase iron-sulfur cluster and FAD-binding subunit A
MKHTEAALRGRPATLDRFEQAAQIAKAEVTPITDVRGAETYRRTLAQNILLKFWHENLARPSNGDGSDNGDAPPILRPDLLRAPSASSAPLR